MRRWRLFPLLLMGLSSQGALAQSLVTMGVNTPGVNDPECRTMALPMVYGLTLLVGIGTFLCLHVVRRSLVRQGWSLANALSEPTRLTIPVEWRWTGSTGGQLSMPAGAAAAKNTLRGPDGAPMPMTLLEASSSRMIATLGGLAILMLYMGFGIFALYSFGLTCQLPPSMAAVSTFLLSGLSLFAPYVANKISTAIQPNIRTASRGDAAPAAPAQPPMAKAPETKAPEPPAPVPTAPVPTAPVVAPVATTTAHAHQQVKAKPEHPPVKTAPSWDQLYAPGLDLIRNFEGFVDHAYPDPASGAEPWTIGYGFTTLHGRPVQPGQTMSRQEANDELQRQAEACFDHLAATIPYWSSMNANQRCCLLDFAWNLGTDFYGDEVNFTSITRDLKNHDWAQVPQTLLLYCDPGSSVEAGLLRRRQAEAKLWTTPAETRPADESLRSRFTNPLKVPYCDQLRMDDGQGWRECFSASSAMLAMYWGKELNENNYDKLRSRYGDSTTSEAQLEALRSLGLTANFQTDGTATLLKQEIDAGRPVAVGWLCDGPVLAPSGGGHWIVIIGYDDSGFFVNDPYGNCDLAAGGYLSHHDGGGLHYSYQNWLPRWRVDGTGGWLLTCRP